MLRHFYLESLQLFILKIVWRLLIFPLRIILLFIFVEMMYSVKVFPIIIVYQVDMHNHLFLLYQSFESYTSFEFMPASHYFGPRLLNPVLQVLTDHLENIRVPFQIEFASLPRSFVILQQSKYVISSRGTFVPSILCCSSMNPNVYYFRDEECQYLGSLMSCFMQRYIVKDMLARYTCQGDWMCLPHQKR